ncbi:phage antirepressor KilAC domain-containing protein [Burkholderia sp. BCC0097]|uniref:phage antirepressor KilAC domain-containing protein n=1 Tax=Burkholderia sp. BCC0097 TaxID=2676289 RepID=UPI00158BDF08|nr:phage antirepressor KilAC domain-containing protein [Burkholderia sp. BCC0097]
MNFDQTQTVTMSSREIADLVGSRHDNVRVAIERLTERGVIALPAMQEKATRGRPSVEYVFRGEQGKRDSIVVVAQLSPEFTARLVDRWQELETQAAKSTFQIPQTLGEALRLAADLEEQRAALENENQEQAKVIEYHKPDVQFAEAMRASDDLLTFDEVAKTLSKIKPIGHINLRRALKDCEILRKDSGLPMQKYVNNGLLAVVQSTWTTPDGEVKINRKVMATGSGMQALTTWYSKYIETLPRPLRKFV